jgi:hypothetical protein
VRAGAELGPLVLVPFTSSGSPLDIGLVLTALPVGFALGAALPLKLPRAGAALSTVACAVPAWQVHPIALAALGFGLGLFTPANNATVLGALPRVMPDRVAACEPRPGARHRVRGGTAAVHARAVRTHSGI